MDSKYLNSFNGLYFLGHRDNSSYNKSKAVIAPISFEGTCSYGLGTKNGPKAILEASHFMEPFDEETLLDIDQIGIHTLKIQKFSDTTSPKRVCLQTQNIVSQILKDKKFPIILGGEHSITIGSFQAIHQTCNNLSLLQIDAHTDLDGHKIKEEYHHAAMAKTISKYTKSPITQVGIRSCIRNHLDFAKKNNIKIYFAHNIMNNKHKISNIASTLTKNVYITVDVDAFDPSVFPNTGTPEPNGLKWQYVINLIKLISNNHNIVALDLVEHSSKDGKGKHHSDYTAARLLQKLIFIIFKEKLKKQN